MSKLRSNCRIVLRIAALCVAATGVSCSSRPENDSQQILRVDSNGQSFPMTVTDQLGRRVRLDSEPLRIVSLAPSNTETLFAVGASRKLVGVTTYCNYPPAAQDVPEVGGFAQHEISLERIVALRPDVVFTTGNYHGQLIEQLSRLDIPTIALEPTSFEEIYRTIALVGRVAGRARRADELVDSMKARVRAVQDATRGDSARPTVLYVVQAQPLMTVGERSFISEVIYYAGGRNVFDDVDADYPTINPEAVISRNPDVIVLPSHGKEYGNLDQLPKSAGWESLKAVKNKRMYTVDGDLMVRTSTRVVDGLEQLAARLFPERFTGR